MSLDLPHDREPSWFVTLLLGTFWRNRLFRNDHILSSKNASLESQEPIRSELFGPERLEQHARSLAAADRVASRRRGPRVAPRVKENGRVLLAAYHSIASDLNEKRAITPAAEWIVDNFHIVEEQLREIEDDLHPGFYRDLPKLAEGHLEGYPRVFGIAWAFVAHTDSHFDPEILRRFVRAYQQVTPLEIGELWAVAIALRIVLVENLRRHAERIVRSREARDEADRVADSLLGAGGAPVLPAASVLRRFEGAALSRAFVVQLTQRLREQGPSVLPAVRWLDEHLAAEGKSADELVQLEIHSQGSANLMARNIITSMRLLSAFDWKIFFESVSLVDELLRAESDFGEMDFRTRDMYRHAIEELARGSRSSELEVARAALRRAKEPHHADGGPDSLDERTNDPGYYLISGGRPAFERELRFRAPVGHQISRAYVAAANPGYVVTVMLFTAVILVPIVFQAGSDGAGVLTVLILELVFFFPASDLAVAVMNRVVTELIGPRPLPKLDLREGVPANLKTMIVIPTLLASVEEFQELIERLEVHYLANSDGEIHFAILSDWLDAASEHAPGDEELLAAAVSGIRRLNDLHGPLPGGERRFFLFHRRRLWNEGERKWMGWERKRGKLRELNRLLRGALDTTFLAVGGEQPRAPENVRYVITLDADTRLPRRTACQLVSAMAHPLNRPRFDPATGSVIEGYGVLQPRVTPSLPTAEGSSLFQRIFSGPAGIDPYAAAVSDVYQDLFHEGSYAGKGIYDVDAFEASLSGRVPENALLSHDLFEGLFARAGLASDIELFEEFPRHYEIAAAREHRWARGDWQLLPWILGHAENTRGDRARAPTALISEWKIVDNLRRTLSAPAAILALLAAWALPFANPLIWTAFVLATIAIPAILPTLLGIIPRRRGISKRTHVRAVATDFLVALAQVTLATVFLAHQACLMIDAIVRTIVRLYITRRHLLEWVTAAPARSDPSADTMTFLVRMESALVIAVGSAIIVSIANPEAWPVAAPFIVLWAFSPAIVRGVSAPLPDARAMPLTTADRRALHRIARRTWRFFESFVGPESHALPPDNFQEEPKGEVARRTSPTNLGMYLLSTVAARDFGWLGTFDFLDRLESTLDTMKGLERFRGHFYNWYEIRDLRVLEPKYVSSVDSGNLAGHLIALANACREEIDRPLLGPERFAGIEDALIELKEAASSIGDPRRTGLVTRKHLDEAMTSVAEELALAPTGPAAFAKSLEILRDRMETVLDIARPLVEEEKADDQEVLAWTEAARSCVASHIRDLEAVFPAVLVERRSFELQASGERANEALEHAEIRAARDVIERVFATAPTLGQIPDLCNAAMAELAALSEGFSWPNRSTSAHPRSQTSAIAALDTVTEPLPFISDLLADLERVSTVTASLVRRMSRLSDLARQLFEEMDFRFLFDSARQLFTIGYRVTDSQLDPNCYDLLASEASLTSFVAIAKGDVPVSHWFRLGRALTPVDRGSALVSWSGSMFEYLMPALVMDPPRGSLLDQTYWFVVRRQVSYGRERGVPWGVSESAYSAFDLERTYQYSSFGVPGLGLKRGLSVDVVIAPYATGLAAMVDAAEAVRNFTRIAADGGSGRYGFYEALDYTPARVPDGTRAAVVRAYMAHHQGMLLVALSNVLCGRKMRARFRDEPMMRATELLLQERTPRDVAVARPRAEEVQAAARARDDVTPRVRRFRSPHDPTPRTHLLSNGRYSVMMTAAGSGYSRWRELAVTRWREDVTRDHFGTYIFIRDVDSGEVWSAGYQPSGVEPSSYEVAYSEERVEIVRRDGAIVTALEVVVSTEDDAEVRRVSLANLGTRARNIELTSYAEIVLAHPAADAAHPAFSNLFVQTEFVPDLDAILATRRPRAPGEREVWAAHVVGSEGETVGGIQFESDRARFLGRGRTIRTPMSVIDGRPLSDTTGPVLDPILSLRRHMHLPAGKTVRVSFSTLVATTREQALDLADNYRHPAAFERALTLAWTQAQAQFHHLQIDADEAHLFQRLANRILYSDPTLRPARDVLERNQLGQSALWAHGISGDLPIILIRIDEPEDRDIVRQCLRAREYWRSKGLAVDLVILNEKGTAYTEKLQSTLEELVRGSPERAHPEEGVSGGAVHILRGDRLPPADRSLLQTVARAVLLSRRGTLAEQLTRVPQPEVATSSPLRRAAESPRREPLPGEPELEFFNGLGGFADGGREYVMVLGEGQWTPMPWINVIANASFGFQVSESGAGYTWAGNSRENQLTPWSNDPVGDPPGEIFYVRDEETGEVWGPTALPIREEQWPYVACHGQGYSRFEHTSHGIALELWQLVALEDPVKISRLIVENRSTRARRLSITAYVEWVLGFSRSASAPFVVTEIDPVSGAMLARNPWRNDFARHIAFAAMPGRQPAFTADRTEFLGRNGTFDSPAALQTGTRLSGAVGPGMDPCACLQTVVTLPPAGRTEIVFVLGEAATKEEARVLVERYRVADVETLLRSVKSRWNDLLGAVEVTTPDRSLDLLVNRWLLYQTLACRLWARAAFYQAGGAYGFRDQLQDVMALVVADRSLAREQILRAAARQFVEGDVQHWWHPPSGRGIRTRISDDLVWLPYALVHYVDVTGDHAILDEKIPFLEGPPLEEGQHESYSQPTVSGESGTLFEHSARALDRSLAVGRHGLPLMGSGDWNDGMNRVGPEGKGESVWLGWFLHATLRDFARFAERRGEHQRADRWRQHASTLRTSLEREAWDGDWYLRAWFDDGTPLGSSANTECRIDSIAQSWSVISGGADPARGAHAMMAVEEYLVRRGDDLVLLFTPPFDRSLPDPGYIKGYLPGVRENGGQYTHAAIWTVLAFAALGEGDKAVELFAILNPINHGSTRSAIHRYKVEPYVMAADVYSERPHVGRGGWTWYTGSAGWMYRAAIEWILGFRLRGAMLFIDPCIPQAWRLYQMAFRYHSTRYEIRVENPRSVRRGVISVEVDGQPMAERDGSVSSGRAEIALVDDGATHGIRVVLG